MPSDPLVARCYCGATRIKIAAPAQAVTYCHCADCKRWTGSPLPAFAAFSAAALKSANIEGVLPEPVRVSKGVARRNCPSCGSPLTAEFDYLPGQIYVPLGVFEDATSLAPQGHAHAAAALPWLCLEDGLPRHDGSARETLNKAT
ncbi:MAG: GFA family protein [Pseudomonadota bacterium]